MDERTRVKPLRWLPYHKRLIEDQSRRIVVEKSRRIGYDYAQAYKHTMRRATGQRARDLWYTSADESAAYEFAEYCRSFLERVQIMVDAFTEDIEDPGHPKGSIKAFCIRFKNGSRINALSSSPRRLRGKGGDVVVSELAFHDDPVELHKAANAVTMWGDAIEFGSSHNGEDNIWNKKVVGDAKAYAAGERTRGGRPLREQSYHFIDIHTAVEQGLVELINETRGTALTREAFVADLRASCIDEDEWLQEFCCIPSSAASAWLPYELIYTCEDAKCPRPGDGLWDVSEDSERYAGIDVGRHKDVTAAWVLGRVGDVLWTRRIGVLEKMPIPEQIDVLEGMLRAAGVRRTCVDATGIGLGLAEGLQKRLGNSAVEAVTFTGPVKEALAVPVRQKFEERTVRIPDDSVVREDLHKVRKTVTATGNVRFDAARDESGHADRFWALALAIQAAGVQTGVRVSLIEPAGGPPPASELDPVEQERRVEMERRARQMGALQEAGA